MQKENDSRPTAAITYLGDSVSLASKNSSDPSADSDDDDRCSSCPLVRGDVDDIAPEVSPGSTPGGRPPGADVVAATGVEDMGRKALSYISLRSCFRLLSHGLLRPSLSARLELPPHFRRPRDVVGPETTRRAASAVSAASASPASSAALLLSISPRHATNPESPRAVEKALSQSVPAGRRQQHTRTPRSKPARIIPTLTHYHSGPRTRPERARGCLVRPHSLPITSAGAAAEKTQEREEGEMRP